MSMQRHTDQAAAVEPQLPINMNRMVQVAATDDDMVGFVTSRMTPSQSKMRAHGAGPWLEAMVVVAFLIAPSAAVGSRKADARKPRCCTNPDASSNKENTHTVFRTATGRSFIAVKTASKLVLFTVL